MSLHNEISFEVEICEYLAGQGWQYADKDAAEYDRKLALFPADVLAWVQATQTAAWEALTKNHGAAAGDTLLSRLRQSIDQQGTLHVLRHGFDVLGLRKEIKLTQFKPALAMNPDIMSRYAANTLRVIRQVRYSLHNENSIDLVLFLNGVPVATVELKTDFTQGIDDAVDQYRFDRNPSPKGQNPEPLLSFPNGALVHFAVSNCEVRMTTRLDGTRTRFLPFNLGDNGAAGNPLNPHGHPTAYLWEQVWARDSWLEILGRYLVAERDDKKNLKAIIFPRYHQLDVTRKLQAAILAEGPGHKYLIQHSAGSGKTNSIAWSAHFLADLHDADNKKVFDTVLVISDRNVIDGQLREAIFGFERTTGVVARIKGDVGSKSSELAEALSGDKKIVVCTIQTFPFAIKAVRELAATGGKRFAVIPDEAHSSQTGEAASKLKQLLSVEEQQELADGGDVSSEDILIATMTSRADDQGITYVAYTATPKAKTLELFGRRPDPSKPASPGNLPGPFHVYSMRQAIEEGFILDVLQNYTSYKLAFKLANDGKEFDDKEVERSAAMKKLMGWVRLHPYNIAQKVQIVVEHYRETVAPLLDGKAKAMVVVSSRLEAVRWQLAINKYIKDKGYPLTTVVAFSGEVDDKESGPEPFKEMSKELNPNLKGRDIREAFKGDEYQILLVANKFQTGFDAPLLCGMYVDKRLAGIQTVQTLSRLNIVGFQIGIIGQKILCRHSRSQQVQNHRHRISQSPNARFSVANVRINRDSFSPDHCVCSMFNSVIVPRSFNGKPEASVPLRLRLRLAVKRKFQLCRLKIVPQFRQKGVELSGFTVSFGEDLFCGDSVFLPHVLHSGDEGSLVLPEISVELFIQQIAESFQDQRLRFVLSDLRTSRCDHFVFLLLHFSNVGFQLLQFRIQSGMAFQLLIDGLNAFLCSGGRRYTNPKRQRGSCSVGLAGASG